MLYAEGTALTDLLQTRLKDRLYINDPDVLRGQMFLFLDKALEVGWDSAIKTYGKEFGVRNLVDLEQQFKEWIHQH